MCTEFLGNEDIGIAVTVVAYVTISDFDQSHTFIMFSLIAVIMPDIVKKTVGYGFLPDGCDSFIGVGYSYFEAVIFLVLDFSLLSGVLNELLILL